MKVKPAILMLFLALSGCATIKPMEQTHQPSEEYAIKKFEQINMAGKIGSSWNESPVVTEGNSSVVLIAPYSIPDHVKNKKIIVTLEPNAKIQDVIAIIGRMGVNCVISDTKVAEKNFYMPRFSGTIGDFLGTLSKSTNTWFTWSNGTLVVSNKERIGISIPQEEGFTDILKKDLASMGFDAKEYGASWQAGMLTVDASFEDYKKLKALLERAVANAAIISMQVAVINLTMSQNAKQGIDWDKLTLSALKGGNVLDNKIWQTANGLGGTATTNTAITTGTTGTTTTSSSTVDSSTLAGMATTSMIGIAGGAAQGAIFGSRFSFSGLFNFLQNYGEAETQQNVTLNTVSGNKTKLKSLVQVPYVSEVGVGSLSNSTYINSGNNQQQNNTTTNNGQNPNLFGTTKTSKAEDGIKIDLMPTFDAASNTVTVKMDLSIKAVISFNELSAGNQIGKFTQPTTADRELEGGVIRLRPGATVVIGGLTYQSVSDNRGKPIFLSSTNILESQNLIVSRQSMFIVLRPTVTRLGQVLTKEADLSAGLELNPQSVDKK